MTKALERILYVEDEDDIRTVAEMALQAVGGFHVIACRSGAEAIAGEVLRFDEFDGRANSE